MSWFISLLVALLSGAASLFIAGFIANLCVSWYDVSSREGASGFFVIYMALFGGIIGAVIGLIVARQTAGYAGQDFGRSFLRRSE